MEIIVLQHIKVEDPGYIKDLMLKDGVNLTTIELDEGEKIPEDLSKNFNVSLITRNSNLISRKNFKVNLEKIKIASNILTFLLSIFKTFKKK